MVKTNGEDDIMMSAGFGVKGHYHAQPAVHYASPARKLALARLHARAYDRVAQPVGGGKVAFGALAAAAVVIAALSATL